MNCVDPQSPVYGKSSFRFSLTDGFVLLFVGSVFLSTFVFNDAVANTTKLVILALLLVLYLCIRLVIDDRRWIIHLLCYFVVLTGLAEAVWGLLQLYGFLPSRHGLFRLTGSFFNPGPYSGYLAVVFPLALYGIMPMRLDKNSKGACPLVWGLRIKSATSAMTVVAILLVLPAGMSRAA